MCHARHEMGEEALLIHCTRTFASLTTTQYWPALSTANRSPSSIASVSANNISVELIGFAEISSTPCSNPSPLPQHRKISDQARINIEFDQLWIWRLPSILGGLIFCPLCCIVLSTYQPYLCHSCHSSNNIHRK